MAATTILVVGATGKQGGQVMATLLNSGRSQISLRFLTRNKSSPNATELISKGATAVVGNLSDRQLLLTALKGVDRAYLVTDAGAGEEKEAELGINFVEAAKEAGVSHMVLSSVSAADLAKDVPHFRSKAKVERSLQASGCHTRSCAQLHSWTTFQLLPGLLVSWWLACSMLLLEDANVSSFPSKILEPLGEWLYLTRILPTFTMPF
ncbi:hypothetical protein J008_02041 [Cryptococcus neoformans]|nr:hypothetical protein J008_02041 [Cryptococcus neoformans var. grubii]